MVKCLIVLSVVLLFLAGTALTIFFVAPHPNNTPNAKKISDLAHLNKALELYAKDHDGLYPPMPLQCDNVGDLGLYLVPHYLRKIPDPMDPDAYRVSFSPDRTAYVLRTTLDVGYPALQQDIDGNILGCDCNDPVYCIVNVKKAASIRSPQAEL